MIEENSRLTAMILTTLLINSRHLLYGLSLSSGQKVYMELYNSDGSRIKREYYINRKTTAL
ncbi:AzlC family ABC transporter permease [Sporosarcina globispora]|uniref:AzlC family ABC transporter permease n=1 Tax=Sporosarcina globispora TaxID=1459 RepID=UPI001F29C2A0|nr:AzlC family ABC transporter permease [Sporosarcina globispora]